jgi:predicted anti-sigma-YlaC factor YlaD
MWNPLKKNRVDCEWFIDLLERDGSTEALPAVLREHVAACEHCEISQGEFAKSRALLSALPRPVTEARPWFAPRVMAAIAAREAEMRRALDAWTIVPKLAVKLTWVSALALVLASTWLFGQPASVSVKQPAATDLTGETVHETITPANNDELLLSLAETGS